MFTPPACRFPVSNGFDIEHVPQKPALGLDQRVRTGFANKDMLKQKDRAG
jgi:hypothetical protein